MKIERINENQIKCTLTRSDLASRQLRMSELAYGTEKARGLFQDMMDQANLEFGFDTSDIPLMIEAIPVSMDCIILMITKVENPDEVDTHFTTLSNLRDIFGNEEPDEELSLSPLSAGSFEEGLRELAELTRKAMRNSRAGTERLCSFDSLDTVMEFARNIRTLPIGESTLYKSPDNGRYYLYMNCAADASEVFDRICTAALEFGVDEPINYARTAFMNEHFEKILSGNAVQSLAYV